MSDELNIVLEDVKGKFDTVIEGIHMLNEKVDRHMEENRKEHERFEMGFLELKRDMNEHRNNTELNSGRVKKRGIIRNRSSHVHAMTIQ